MGVVARRAGSARARASPAPRQRADVVITSGGVSVGEADYVKRSARQARRSAVLEDRDEAGTAARVRQGRRRAFLRPARQSRLGDGDVLPVRARRAADPAGRGATFRRCRRSRATLAAPIRKAPGRTEFQRGILAPDGAAAGRCAPPATRARASCRRCRRRTASSCCRPTPATSPPATASTCSCSKG